MEKKLISICLILLMTISSIHLFAEDNSTNNSNFVGNLFLPIDEIKQDEAESEESDSLDAGTRELGGEQAFKVGIFPGEWMLRPVVTIPAMKIVESSREDAELDVLMFKSIGAGLSFQKLYKDNNSRWKSSLSFALLFLIAGATEDDIEMDLSVGGAVGIFNDLLMFGCGYDFGSIEGDRNRFFGLLSLGLNFNN